MGDTDKTLIVRMKALRREPEPTAESGFPGLVVLGGSDIGKVFYFDEEGRTIGRDPEIAICVGDTSVSRRHAQVYKQVDEDSAFPRYLIVDLHSTNGTFVNGERVSKTFLNNGDKVQLGNVVLKFIIHDDADHQYHQEIHRRISIDDLTGLLTLNVFNGRLAKGLHKAKADRTSCMIVMMDVDHLKAVNEAQGHLAGSFVIKTIGDLLRQELRGTAIIGRYGGDEFIAYLTGIETAAAMARLDKARLAIASRAFDFRGNKLSVSISMGVASFPWDGHATEELIASADEALMRAKRLGKNRIETFSEK